MDITRRLVVCGMVAAAIAAAPSSALADETDSQLVTGTAENMLALDVPSPTILAGFLPAQTAAASALVKLTSTSPTWTLSAKTDTNGHMAAAEEGCDHSTRELDAPLSLIVEPIVADPRITSTLRDLTSLDQTFASSTDMPVSSALFHASYTQPVRPTEVVEAGCVYSLTTTFTLS